MIRAVVHTFIWFFILALVCACGAAPEGVPAEPTYVAPAPAALPVVDLTTPDPKRMPGWTDVQVIRDPETGCQYLKSASGDLEKRMRGASAYSTVAEYQMGCTRPD